MEKRIVGLDVCRSFAICAVVLCHCIENIFVLDVKFYNMQSLNTKLFIIIMFTLGRIGVPLFLFLSGYLLLPRSYEMQNKCIGFWKNNLLPLLLSVEVWNLLYCIIFKFIKHSEISISQVIKYLLFIDHPILPHLWYMQMIIGVYIFIPFISKALKNIEFKVLLIPLILGILKFFILNNYNQLYNHKYNWFLDITFIGGIYGIYLLLGYISKKYISSHKLFFSVLFIFSFIYIIYMQMNRLGQHTWYYVYYNCFPLLICGFSLFEILKDIKINNKILIKVFKEISTKSLGIYFLHYPIILLFNKIIKNKLTDNNYILTLVYFISTLLICYFTTYVFQKNKLCSRLLFANK